MRIEAGNHTAPINAIDMSADGRFLLTAGKDKTARLWDAKTGDLLKIFRVPIAGIDGGQLYAAALSPDGKLAAVGGYDANLLQNNDGGFVYLFDTATAQIVKRLGPMSQTVNDIAFSPDGSRIAVGLHLDQGVRVWTAPFYGAPAVDQDYSDAVSGLAFAPDNHLFVVTQDGLIRHYDQDMNGVARGPSEDQAALAGIAASEKAIAITYRDAPPRIHVIDRNSLRGLYAVDTSGLARHSLEAIAWSADGEILYGGGSNFIGDDDPFVLYAWDQRGQGKRRAIGQSWAQYTNVTANPNGGVAWATSDPAFGLLDPQGMTEERVIADMREKLGEKFTVSEGGEAVRFSFDYGGKEPWLFDGAKLTFSPSPTPPNGFHPADVTSLPINWEDTDAPMSGDARIPIGDWDRSHSLAISPNKKTFILGMNYTIAKYDVSGGQFWRHPVPGTTWGVNLSSDGLVVVAAHADGTIRWYDALYGEELLAFYVHTPSKRWIAWTPQGYYAASPGAEELIGWHVNGKSWSDTPKFYPASRFRDQFYRPDIIARVVALRSVDAAVKEANNMAGRKDGPVVPIDALLPASVTLLDVGEAIEAKTQEISVNYLLTSPTGRAVTRVEARIDDRPVSTRGAAEVDESLALDTPQSLTLDVPPRDVLLSIIAYIGDQPSVAAEIPIRWLGEKTVEKKPKLFAVLAGISEYNNKELNLGFAAKDAEDFAGALKAQEGLFYDTVDIETVVNSDATKSAIEAALVKLRKKATADDMVIVFLAGHGVTDASLDYYYLSADAEMEEVMLPATAVSGDVIRKSLAKVPGKVVLFMDTCRSGAGIEGLVDMSRAANDFGQEAAGLVMFASSQGREVSYERADWQNGAFTEALLSIIDDAKYYGEDGRLSIPELEEAVTTKVAELTEGRQNAGMTKYGAIPRFFIAAVK
ncbi:MAG: caspase family protein [Alphaproteobacteria bacterium]|nr:caspase family protein [Alphaproteobacteria bacterium]